MNLLATNPIGIFDSGIGGLTVAHAITEALPDENIIYYGDTAHLPYGNKSQETIQHCAERVAKILLNEHCKLIIIACNSASAAAFESIKQMADGKALVLNVIDPIVEEVLRNHKDKRLGLIGTQHTINSNVYAEKLSMLHKEIQLQQFATPLLASTIESSFHNEDIINDLLNEYLPNPSLKNIETLILGCTHYPVVKKHIEDFYNASIPLLDSAELIGKHAKALLEEHSLLNHDGKGEKAFYVSDLTESFSNSAKQFFDEGIELKLY